MTDGNTKAMQSSMIFIENSVACEPFKNTKVIGNQSLGETGND